jgi:hypothetical protein
MEVLKAFAGIDQNNEEVAITTFDVRYQEIGSQLNLCLLAQADHLITYRFITQVLPVMYANLLYHYGDHTASHDFMRQITDSTYYTELYVAISQ